MNKLTIAIDGPAGAGKSTIAKELAKKLGIVYIDTGAMYRTVALAVIRKGMDTNDEQKVAEIVKDLDISIELTKQGQVVFLGKENVNNLIRSPEVSVGSSNVARVLKVREKMVELQRKLAEKNSLVMDGRDIGTRVLPDADVKIYLTASVEERAKRRYDEMLEKGMIGITLKEVEEDIKQRDYNDSNREHDPLKIAQNAKIVDTSKMLIPQVIETILEQIKKVQVYRR